jgi:protein-S-isoprenylcysteine O-methyltransferase Ste14
VTDRAAPPTSDASSAGTRPTVTLQIGQFKLTGPLAGIALLAILAGIVALIVYSKPSLSSWPLWASGVLWIVFISYWNAAAAKAAPTKSSESAQSRAVHTRMLNGAFLLLFLPIPGLRWRFVPDATSIALVGLGIQAAFFVLAVSARKHLGRNWSGAITVAEDHQLVRSGPYRILRHPIYTAMLGMFAGSAVVFGQLHALLAVALITGAYWRKIGLEEQNLRNLFGPSYEEYRRDTWALVPGLY